MGNRVVYTAIIGDYDDVPRPACVMEGWDYVLFTDQGDTRDTGPWEIRPPAFVLEDATRTARWHKLNPHEIFPGCDRSIWMDSNVTTNSDFLERRVEELSGAGALIASFRHPDRNCAYAEAEACVQLGKDDPQVIAQTVDFLTREGYPRDRGLYETNVLFRRHSRGRIVELDRLWWRVLETNSRRDQVSFPYCLWKLELECALLSEAPGQCARNHPGFDMAFSHRVDRAGRSPEQRWKEWAGVARLGLKYHRFGQALEAARKCLAISETPQGWNLLGVALANLERRDEAREAFGRALDLGPEARIRRAIRANLERAAGEGSAEDWKQDDLES